MVMYSTHIVIISIGNAGGVNHKGDDIYICLPCTKEFLAWLDKPKNDIRGA